MSSNQLESMAGGTIRSHRKVVHRESSRALVLNRSGGHAVLQRMTAKQCLLTTPSLLSRGTLRVFLTLRGNERKPPAGYPSAIDE